MRQPYVVTQKTINDVLLLKKNVPGIKLKAISNAVGVSHATVHRILHCAVDGKATVADYQAKYSTSKSQLQEISLESIHQKLDTLLELVIKMQCNTPESTTSPKTIIEVAKKARKIGW